MISSLFAGNAIIIKSSEQVAWSTKNYFEKLIHACLEAHDMPKDMVQFVMGEGDVGATLVNAGIDKVTFIGYIFNGDKVYCVVKRTHDNTYADDNKIIMTKIARCWKKGHGSGIADVDAGCSGTRRKGCCRDL
jgi:delta 1-pyrroline-5-carboxylate dehydrogenase